MTAPSSSSPRSWSAEVAVYGHRSFFGPWHRQAARWVGRLLERAGAALEAWSWRWSTDGRRR